MKLTFIGVGSAFSLKNLHSNMLLESTSPETPPSIEELETKIELHSIRKDEAVKNADYEEAARHRDEAEILRKTKEKLQLELVKVPTVQVTSYGLLIKTGKGEAFLTTHTQFCPRQIEDFYKRAWIIFQDCEAAPYKSGVHAHYDDLRTLDADIKSKMWLYHYPDSVIDDDTWAKRAKVDGFAGFIMKGQSFEI
jgi:hypothetical protein